MYLQSCTPKYAKKFSYMEQLCANCSAPGFTGAFGAGCYRTVRLAAHHAFIRRGLRRKMYETAHITFPGNFLVFLCRAYAMLGIQLYC